MFILATLLVICRSAFRSRAALGLEIVALRQQIGVLKLRCQQAAEVKAGRPSFLGCSFAGLE
jgi:hypothetical protein